MQISRPKIKKEFKIKFLNFFCLFFSVLLVLQFFYGVLIFKFQPVKAVSGFNFTVANGKLQGSDSVVDTDYDNNYYYIATSADLVVIKKSDLSQQAYATLSGITSMDLDETYVYLGTSANGVYRLAISSIDTGGNQTGSLSQWLTTGSTPAIASNVVTDLSLDIVSGYTQLYIIDGELSVWKENGDSVLNSHSTTIYKNYSKVSRSNRGGSGKLYSARGKLVHVFYTPTTFDSYGTTVYGTWGDNFDDNSMGSEWDYLGNNITESSQRLNFSGNNYPIYYTNPIVGDFTIQTQITVTAASGGSYNHAGIYLYDPDLTGGAWGDITYNGWSKDTVSYARGIFDYPSANYSTQNQSHAAELQTFTVVRSGTTIQLTGPYSLNLSSTNANFIGSEYPALVAITNRTTYTGYFDNLALSNPAAIYTGFPTTAINAIFAAKNSSSVNASSSRLFFGYETNGMYRVDTDESSQGVNEINGTKVSYGISGSGANHEVLAGNSGSVKSISGSDSAAGKVAVGTSGDGAISVIDLSNDSLAASYTTATDPATLSNSISSVTYLGNSNDILYGTAASGAGVILDATVPDTPSITSPANGATDQPVNPTLTSSAYSGDFEHLASDWQICADSGCFSVVWYKYDDSSNLTSIAVNDTNGTFQGILAGATKLLAHTQYYARVRHTNTIGDSVDYSSVVSFTTANAVPSLTINSATQKTDGSGTVDISTTVSDSDSDNVKLKLEYKSGADCSSGTSDPTLDQTAANVSASTEPKPVILNTDAYQVGTTTPILTTSGANTVQFDWSSKTETDLPAGNGTYCLKITPNDGTTDGTAQTTTLTIDNVVPTAGEVVNVITQPQAGDTTVTLGSGTFTETNPGTNSYYISYIDGDTNTESGYGAATAGTTDTASPANASVSLGGYALQGNDEIAKIKLVHTDDYGNSTTMENVGMDNKYVKPYTPQAPTVNSPTANSLNITVNKHASETDDIDYTIQETSTGKYVHEDGLGIGSLGTGAEWATPDVWENMTISGLISPVSSYIFKVRSSNPRDNEGTTLSEWSATASISNTTPTVAITSTTQNVSGRYVDIAYTLTDPQSDTQTLSLYQYSVDGGTIWATMTEKSGVGSESTTNLTSSPTGVTHHFMWNYPADTSATSAMVKLRASDGVDNGNTATSSSFTLNSPPTSTVPTASLATNGSGEVTISFTLDDTDDNDVTVKVEYSINNGGSYSDATLSTLTSANGVPTLNNFNAYQISAVPTTSGANAITVKWLSQTDAPTADVTQAKIKVTPNDSAIDGTAQASTAFVLDNVVPATLDNFAEATQSTTSVGFSWTAATDTNFNHYEIWYGLDSSDVSGRTGTASEWDNDPGDSNLSTATTAATTITGLNPASWYYFKIWAIDDYGNETTDSSVNINTLGRRNDSGNQSSSTTTVITTPTVATPVCGNSVLESGEECDGSAPEHYTCAQCQKIYVPYCGDGTKDLGEGCDDGNLTNGDGCSNQCNIEAKNPVCGNGVIESQEQCDDGNKKDGDGCNSICLKEIQLIVEEIETPSEELLPSLPTTASNDVTPPSAAKVAEIPSTGPIYSFLGSEVPKIVGVNLENVKPLPPGYYLQSATVKPNILSKVWVSIASVFKDNSSDFRQADIVVEGEKPAGPLSVQVTINSKPVVLTYGPISDGRWRVRAQNLILPIGSHTVKAQLENEDGKLTKISNLISLGINKSGNQFVTNPLLYPGGTIVKSSDSHRIYFITPDQEKRYVSDLGALAKLKIAKKNIIVVTPEHLALYPESDKITGKSALPDGYLFKYANARDVYRLEDGKKRPIKNEDVFRGLGGDWRSVITVAKTLKLTSGEMIE